MNENPFGDLFGDIFGKNPGKEFNDIFGDLFGKEKKKNSDPALEALLKTFNDEMKKGDKKFLKKAIIRHRLEVYERANHTELLETYARAAIFVDDNKISYESLTKITNPKNKHKEVIGLISFDSGDFNKALEYLEQIEPEIHESTRIPYSISLLENGIKEFSRHEKILAPIREKVQLANAILGCILYNDSRFEDAENYFRNAAKNNPSSERVRLDLMRILYINDKLGDIYSDMNSFFIDTGSKLSHQEIDKELKERVLKVPKIKINNLYIIISNILGY